MSDLQAAPRPLRADIVEAATRAFSRHGYHGTSMTHIAEELGMRKASLYHHVSKKEDLLFAIHDALIDELTAATLEVVSTSRTPEEKLREVLRVSMRFVARHRDGVTVFLQERRAVTGERWEALVARRDLYEQLVTQVIAGGTAAGAFVPVRADIAARGVLAMANWGYTWFDDGGDLTADEVADAFADIALRGLVVR
jgi:AcrR family transcriptional regulator